MINSLILNGNVLTMNPVTPRAQAIAVANGQVLAVGSNDELDGLWTFAAHILDLERAHVNGIQVALHAIGDAACRMALDSIERANVKNPRPDHRHRIEQEQVVSLEDLTRFAATGIIASLQLCHATTDLAWVESRFGLERMPGAYAWRSFVASGAPICLGTDWPVETLDPRVGLYAVVTRQDLHGNPPSGVQPREALTIEQALRGCTLDSAWAEFAERRKCSIEPGKFADFVILDRDPFPIEPRDLLQVRVLATIVNGQTVYSEDARCRSD